RDRVRRAEDLADLVGPARVPDPAVDGPVHGRAGGGGPETLGGLDLGGELLAPALHQLRHAVEHLAAVHGGPPGPAREGGTGRPDRVADVLARRTAGIGEGRPVRARDEVRAAALGPR